MRIARKNLLPATSLALVSIAAVAVWSDAANAQEARVRYGTDPGFAGAEGPQVLSYRAEDAPDPAGEVIHTVQAGETVYALGRLYKVPPSNIIASNGLIAPYGLQIGQVLVIPMGPVAAPRAQNVRVDRQALPGLETLQPEAQSQRFNLDTVYTVRPGDTLFSLSRRFGVSVADLAAANRMRQPYQLAVNQRLVIPGAARPQQQTARPNVRRAPDNEALRAKVVEETLLPRDLPQSASGNRFAWPIRGTVLVDFGADDAAGESSQGINIAAPIGAPVRATADGEVVYRGSELNGYGNLLLVKHDGGWVSAYAHTDAILVRKGDFVRQGQVIAKVGRSGSVSRPQLHFQLRKDLQPQDPILALQGDAQGQALTAASLQ